MTSILLDHLPIICAEWFYTYTSGFWDILDHLCADRDSLSDAQASGQCCWNFYVLPLGGSAAPCNMPLLHC